MNREDGGYTSARMYADRVAIIAEGLVGGAHLAERYAGSIAARACKLQTFQLPLRMAGGTSIRKDLIA
jgi:hypothetical protein